MNMDQGYGAAGSPQHDPAQPGVALSGSPRRARQGGRAGLPADGLVARARTAILFCPGFCLLVGLGDYDLLSPHNAAWLTLYAIGATLVVVMWAARLRRSDTPTGPAVYCGAALALALAVSAQLHDPASGLLVRLFIAAALLLLLSAAGFDARITRATVLSGGVTGVLLCAVGGELSNGWHLLLGYLGIAATGVGIAEVAAYLRRYKPAQLRRRRVRRHEMQAAPCSDLVNQSVFAAALAREWQENGGRQSLALLMLDIDHFGHYVEQYGDERRDACLRLISSLVAAYANPACDLASRNGAGEFLLLLPNTCLGAACTQAQQILQLIRNAHIPQPRGLGWPWLSISIGVAVAVPEAGAQPVSLVDAAVYSLRGAQLQGGDCWHYMACQHAGREPGAEESPELLAQAGEPEATAGASAVAPPAPMASFAHTYPVLRSPAAGL